MFGAVTLELAIVLSHSVLNSVLRKQTKMSEIEVVKVSSLLLFC